MSDAEAHMVAKCRGCGAPQPLTLSAPLGECDHCGDADPVGPELRTRIDGLRAQLAKRDQTPRQLTTKVLVAGDALHTVGLITIVICWLLFGGIALYVSLSHDVAFAEFVTSGEPAPQWWLLWSFAVGLALSFGLLEFGVARVRGLSAEALPAPPTHDGAPPRCRCCAANLDPGTALRRCRSCHTDNLVVGRHYLRAERNIDRSLDSIEKQFDRDLAARIDTGDTIAMAGGVVPFFLLFGGAAIGLITPGKADLWLAPAITAVFALTMALLARRRRLPVEALELLSVGDTVYIRSPVDGKRSVCAQLMLDSGPVSLLGKTAEEADYAVAPRRIDGNFHAEVYRVKPGTTPASDQERVALVPTDLWNKAKRSEPTVRRVYTLTTDNGWRTFTDQDRSPHIDGNRSSKPPVVVVI